MSIGAGDSSWPATCLTDMGAACLQGSSPDEVALVEGARALGFEFVGINGADYTVSFGGVKATYQVPDLQEHVF